MDNGTVNLFVGSPVEVRSERELIARLRTDLEREGIKASLYANFFTLRRNQRQIDLLVRLPWRTSHVEIKGLDPDLPVIAAPNGPWRRRLPDGNERTEGNYGKQTLDGTYAIGDTMVKLARRNKVPDRGDFKRHIDGILCLWEHIPPGSEIDVPKHVTVVGYDGLFERLRTPGPKIDWSDDDWEAFVRCLSLYQPEPETPVEARRRISADQVNDYRSRAHTALRSILGPHIDTGVRGGDGSRFDTDAVESLVATGGLVVLSGLSGTGKTNLAQHLAVRHCERGRLVIWARCGEYDQGRFGELLDRSAAPYSAARRSDLVPAAVEAGAGVTVILDGLDECPEGLRAELVQQLNAFRLRHPAAVLVTTNTDVPALDSLGPVTLAIEHADGESRRAILHAHGSKRPELISSAFTTPYELAIAATCEAELGEFATLPQVHDAYIRRSAPERVRAGLRTVASVLHAQLRSSVAQIDITQHLASPAGGTLTASEIDEVLDCPLLVVERHRVRFRHELLARFLAAEALVHAAADGAALGAALAAPANSHLEDDALAIERDTRRRWAAMVELGKSTPMVAALTGAYGTDCASHALESTRAVLRRAIDRTRPELARFELVDESRSRWLHQDSWTLADRAILVAAGGALVAGLLVEEIGELFDATDMMCTAAINEIDSDIIDLRTLLIAATYGQGGWRDDHALPATFVSYGCEMQSMGTRFQRLQRPSGTALCLSDRAASTSYGRLYAAGLLSDPRSDDEQEHFADLLQRCWDSRAYHIRLHALESAKFFQGSPEPARTRILDVVNGLRTRHWALQSTIVEVLAAFGAIEPAVTVKDIHEQIRTTIANADDPGSWAEASSILSCRYEPEEIVGPYTEAIGTLTDTERARLLLMAVRSTETFAMFRSSDLGELADLVPTGDADLDDAIKNEFARRAGMPPRDDVMPTELIDEAVGAVIGWSRFDNQLPPLPAGATPETLVWHDVMRLVVLLQRDDSPTDPTEIWHRLRTQPAEAVRALAMIDVADRRRPWDPDDLTVIPRLLRMWPDDVNVILTWALANPRPAQSERPWLNVHAFTVRAIGAVGDLQTVEDLRPYLPDPDVGESAARSIRQINERHGT